MGKPVILCVDDEQVILNSLKIQLKKEFNDDFLFEAAESASEAIELLEELQQEAVSVMVIVSDWLMPGMKGDQFLIEVHKKFPKVIKIMLTGQADEEAIEKAKKEANLHSCILKPWDSDKLIKEIKSGLERLENEE